MRMTEYRHEWKHEITFCDMLAIRQRMRAIAKADRHAYEGSYGIRSLYFDNLTDKALREKLDGVNRREKFRIRYYIWKRSASWTGWGRKRARPLRRRRRRR